MYGMALRDVLERAAFDFHNLAPHDPACECPRKFLALSSDDESADVGVGVARGGGRDGSSYEWDMKRHGAGALGGAARDRGDGFFYARRGASARVEGVDGGAAARLNRSIVRSIDHAYTYDV